MKIYAPKRNRLVILYLAIFIIALVVLYFWYWSKFSDLSPVVHIKPRFIEAKTKNVATPVSQFNSITVYRGIRNTENYHTNSKLSSDIELPIEINKSDKISRIISDNLNTDNCVSDFNIKYIASDSAQSIASHHKKKEYYYGEVICGLDVTVIKKQQDSMINEYKRLYNSLGFSKPMSCQIKQKYSFEHAVYTIQLGNFDTFNEARNFCKKLLSLKYDCLVVKN